MPATGLLCHVALVRTDVMGERSTSIIKATIISELGTVLAVTSSLIHITLMLEAIRSSEMSDRTRATQCNNPEMGFFVVTAVKTSNLTQLDGD
jgi:hypothetical protein